MRPIVTAGAFALPCVPFLFGLDPGRNPAGALLVALATLGAPGAAGALTPGGTGPPRRFVRGLGAAALVNLLAVASLKAVGIAPTTAAFAVALAIPTAALAAWATARGSRPVPDRVSVVIGASAFLAAWAAGTHVVPPLEDQDMEVQGTAYGLAHDLQPICATNRSTLYWFAHPLLHHAFVASSLILTGDLETVRPAYDLAREKLDELPPEERARGPAAIARALRHAEPKTDLSFDWFHRALKPFLADPALTGTRVPSFAFAAAVAVLLFLWARARGIAPLDASLVVAVYATLPEVFVRSGYGGYYASTSAVLLAGAWLAGGERGGARSGFAAGFLASLLNQKTFLFAAAVLLHRWIGEGLARLRRTLRRVPVVVGVVAGAAAFWVYGLALFPSDFVMDHLLNHGLRRFDLVEAVGRGGRAIYPSRGGLWLEFAVHTGWIWIAVTVAAVAWGLRRLRSPFGVVPVWIVLGSVAFTILDWRQTKHLSLLIPAMAMAQAQLLVDLPPRLRVALRILLVTSLAWNAWWIVRLARDFSSLSVTPLW